MKAHSLLGLVLTLTASVAVGQRNFDNFEIKATPVVKNLYLLEGSGGNIGASIEADGHLILDDQFAPLAEKIDAALQK